MQVLDRSINTYVHLGNKTIKIIGLWLDSYSYTDACTLQVYSRPDY